MGYKNFFFLYLKKEMVPFLIDNKEEKYIVELRSKKRIASTKLNGIHVKKKQQQYNRINEV